MPDPDIDPGQCWRGHAGHLPSLLTVDDLCKCCEESSSSSSSSSSSPSSTPHTPSTTPHTPSTTPHTPSTTPHTPSTTPHTPGTTPHTPHTSDCPKRCTIIWQCEVDCSNGLVSVGAVAPTTIDCLPAPVASGWSYGYASEPCKHVLYMVTVGPCCDTFETCTAPAPEDYPLGPNPAAAAALIGDCPNTKIWWILWRAIGHCRTSPVSSPCSCGYTITIDNLNPNGFLSHNDHAVFAEGGFFDPDHNKYTGGIRTNYSTSYNGTGPGYIKVEGETPNDYGAADPYNFTVTNTGECDVIVSGATVIHAGESVPFVLAGGWFSIYCAGPTRLELLPPVVECDFPDEFSHPDEWTFEDFIDPCTIRLLYATRAPGPGPSSPSYLSCCDEMPAPGDPPALPSIFDVESHCEDCV